MDPAAAAEEARIRARSASKRAAAARLRSDEILARLARGSRDQHREHDVQQRLTRLHDAEERMIDAHRNAHASHERAADLFDQRGNRLDEQGHREAAEQAHIQAAEQRRYADREREQVDLASASDR